MKYTLNAEGQKAISQFLENIGSTDRPWKYYGAAEVSFGADELGSANVSAISERGVMEKLTLAKEWFDGPTVPPTFEEVLLVMVKLRKVLTEDGNHHLDVVREADSILLRCTRRPMPPPWINWHCPTGAAIAALPIAALPIAALPIGVGRNDIVSVQYRDDTVAHDCKAGNLVWAANGKGHDIVRYMKKA